MATLRERIEELLERTNDLAQNNAVRNQMCKDHLEKTEDIRTILFKEPTDLVRKVDTLWGCKTAFKERLTVWQSFVLGIVKALLIVVILGTSTWLMTMYVEHQMEKIRNISKEIVSTEAKTQSDSQLH